MQSAKYKDYANLQLGNYWYAKKDWKKAKQYYTTANSLGGAGNKDFVLYQLANLNSMEGRDQEALKLYRAVYKSYPGKYGVQAKTKAAEIFEKLGDEKSYLSYIKNCRKSKKNKSKSMLWKNCYISLWKKKI
ncbi:Tetratricopeptide repeat [Fusobacterium necrophorum subsp. necrophorum]|nr:Tetratricopeptide repeat [Fusobacterium necrophorum subsp. necrophorum]